MKDTDKTPEQLEAEIATLSKQMAALRAQIKPIEKELCAKSSRMDRLAQMRDTKLIEAAPEPDWEFLFATDHIGSVARSKALQKALEPYHLSTSGYFPDTGQRALQLAVPWDADDAYLAAMVAGIEAVLPVLKSTVDRSFKIVEAVPMDIMEYTLSQFRSYNARYDRESDKWLLVSSCYGSPSVHGTYDTVLDFLRTLRTSHPYPQDPRVNYDEGSDYDD